MAQMFIQPDPGIERKKRLAEALSLKGQNYGPVQHWTQGMDRVASSLIGAYTGKKAEEADKLRKDAAMQKLSHAISDKPMQGQQQLEGNSGLSVDLGQGDKQGRLAEALMGVNPQMAVAYKLQQEQAQREAEQAERARVQGLRDQLSLHKGKRQIDQEYPKPESEFDRYLKTLQAQKAEQEIAASQTEQAATEKKANDATLQMEDLLSVAQDVFSDDDGLRAYSGYSGNMPTFRPEQKSFEAKLNKLLNSLTLENTKYMTGVLSESDIKLLANAATSIAEGGDYGANKEELMRVINKLEAGLGLEPTSFEGPMAGNRKARRETGGWGIRVVE